MTGAHVEWLQRLTGIALAFATATASMFLGAADLPPEIQADRYLVQAERQIQAGDHAEALTTLDKIVALQADHGLVVPSAFWFKYAQASQDAERFAQAAESATRYLTEAGQQGQYYMAALQILDASSQELEAKRQREAEEREHLEREVAAERPFVEEYRAARQRLAAAGGRVEGAFADRLTIGGFGPEMVVVPAGRFRMGCLSDDKGCGWWSGDCRRDSVETPAHKVVIRQPFALSKYELTFADWDVCVSAGGCNDYRPSDEGRGRDSRPVINVSWIDAQSYAS